MSIYPKRVTTGENVIIHLRFQNNGKREELVEYHLDVYNSLDELIFNKIDNILLGKENYLYETYQSVAIDKSFIPGKYRVSFSLLCRGNVIQSDTKDWDQFYVEEVLCYKDKNSIYIYNPSNEEVSIKLIGKKNKSINLKGKKDLIIEGSYDYYCYGNNKLFPIINKNGDIYQKKCSIRIQKDSLYDINTDKSYYLSNDDLERFHNLDLFVSKKDIIGLENFFIKVNKRKVKKC